MRTIVLAGIVSWMLCQVAFASSAAASDFPEDSLYNVRIEWTDENNQTIELSRFAGRYIAITMAYTKCRHTCPMIMGKLRSLEAKANAAGRKLDFVVASMDPKRDTPEELARYEEQQKVDKARWHFLHGSEENVRKLSLLLGISYQAAEGNEFMHSNVIHLLDDKGRIIESAKGLNAPIEPMIDALK